MKCYRLRKCREPVCTLSSLAKTDSRTEQRKLFAIDLTSPLGVQDVTTVLRALQKAVRASVLEQIWNERSLRHDLFFSCAL